MKSWYMTDPNPARRGLTARHPSFAIYFIERDRSTDSPCDSRGPAKDGAVARLPIVTRHAPALPDHRWIQLDARLRAGSPQVCAGPVAAMPFPADSLPGAASH